jgi:hypothetical protein
MRVRSVALTSALLVFPCASFAGAVEQNLQYSMNVAPTSRTGNDCQNWTDPGIGWSKDGLSVDPVKLALTLAVNAAASHSAPHSVAEPKHACQP